MTKTPMLPEDLPDILAVELTHPPVGLLEFRARSHFTAARDDLEALLAAMDDMTQYTPAAVRWDRKEQLRRMRRDVERNLEGVAAAAHEAFRQLGDQADPRSRMPAPEVPGDMTLAELIVS